MDLAPGLEADLWRRIRTDGDARAAEQLIVHYSGWAAAIARGIHRRLPAYPVDCEDFVQNARVGLMEAVSRFDPERGIPFPAFAKSRVRGAVFNGLRAILGDRSPHAMRALDDERLALLLEEPVDDPLDRVVEAILGLGTAFLLDDQDDGDPSAYAGRAHMQRRIRSQVARLQERQRVIIEQHYFQHVPFVDIATRLGLTKGRISQLHSQALRELRSLLHEGG
jgi:RNA polymerase sigma factor for flagellar operon FliA